MALCISCGATGAAEGARCSACLGPDGPLPFDPVLDRAAADLVRTQGLDPGAARAAASAYLAGLPAWSGGASRPRAATLVVRAGVGDVRLVGGPDGAPRVDDEDGAYEVLETDGGWLVRPRGDRGTAATGDWADGTGDLEIAVPDAIAEVAVSLRCGDLDAERLAGRLVARVLSGDVDVREVGGLDLWVQAGDVDLDGPIRGGEHRAELMAGDMDVRLPAGSDVALALEVRAGDAELEGLDYRMARTGGTSRYEATLGEGRGRLSLLVMAGDVEVDAR